MTDDTDAALAATEASAAALEDTLARLEDAAEGFGSALSAALKGAVTDGRSLDAVLRQLGSRLSDQALAAALKPLDSLVGSALGSAVGGLSSLLGFSDGGVIGAAGPVTAFAAGGVVGAPTLFGMAGGGLGLMGEAGPEAVMPLARDASGRLGVRGAGGGGGGVTVTVNVATPDVAGFRRSEAQLTGMLARAVGRGRRGL